MKVTLDGVRLEVEAGAGWALSTGTAPSQLTLELDAVTGVLLREQATLFGSTLAVHADDGTVDEFRRLTILGDSPTASRFTDSLTVVDPRWVMPNYATARYYNVRLKTGSRRREASDGPLVARAVVDDEAYAAWSMNNGVKWEPADVVRDVLNWLADPIPGETGLGIPWEDRYGVLDALDLPPVEGLEVAGNGAAVVGQVLAYMGGLVSLWVDRDGTLVLLAPNDLSEYGLVGLPVPGQQVGTRERGKGGPGPRALVDEQFWSVQERRLERPAYVEYLVPMAVELRVNGEETANPTSTTNDQPRATQVLKLTEDATVSGREALAGQWVDQLAWHTWLVGKSPAGLPNLSREVARKGWLHNVLEAYARLDPSGVWAGRIGSLRQSFRVDWQLARPWRDRIRTIETFRVGVWDYETGSRGACPVFVDYSSWLAWNATESRSTTDGPRAHERVRNNYAARDGGGGIHDARIDAMLAQGKAAPAELSVQDQDLKIVRIGFATDWRGQVDAYLASALTKDSLPSLAPGDQPAWLQDGELTPGHQVSFLLTCVPAAPRDNRRFYRVRVEPADVPEAAGASCLGPPVQVIASSKVVARFAWDDDLATQIYQVFSEATDEDADPQDLLPEPSNLDELRAVALAKARSIYLGFVDHVEGSLATTLDPTARPTGNVERVLIEAGPRGATTRVEFASKLPEVDVSALMPPDVRRLVDRFVDL